MRCGNKTGDELKETPEWVSGGTGWKWKCLQPQYVRARWFDAYESDVNHILWPWQPPDLSPNEHQWEFFNWRVRQGEVGIEGLVRFTVLSALRLACRCEQSQLWTAVVLCWYVYRKLPCTILHAPPVFLITWEISRRSQALPRWRWPNNPFATTPQKNIAKVTEATSI